MENQTIEKEMYQQPLAFKHQALVDLTLAKSPKDSAEKGPIEKNPVKEDLDNKTFEKNPIEKSPIEKSPIETNFLP